ncbi:sigma-54 dependent transcriptional regulator, flagellar regulatory protein [Desulfovibrionales bacterium]
MQLNLCNIIGRSQALSEVFKILAKVAPTDSTVLVTGESGTGKELLVRALHANSVRRKKAFVPINCSAIPKNLLESELFGHEKGAFTHAIRTRAGRFERADGGTIFLDEIGDMSLDLQVKILRVLQEKEIERIGGSAPRKVDVRIVAATNRDLEREVQVGCFREDLFYRLNVIPLRLPPLRERGEDIFLLADSFLERFSKRRDTPLVLTDPARAMLLAYSWPGNIRELENFIERMSILCEGTQITHRDLPHKILAEVGAASLAQPASSPTSSQADFVWPVIRDLKGKNMDLKKFLDEIEDRLLTEALSIAKGIKNQAAEILGIKRTTLIEKLRKKKLGE